MSTNQKFKFAIKLLEKDKEKDITSFQPQPQNQPIVKLKLSLKSKLKLKTPTLDTNTKTEQNPMKSAFDQIVLVPYQVAHVAKIENILDKHPVCLDMSMLGSGKTYTSSYISLHSKFAFKHVIVICPANITSNWKKMKDVYGVPITHLETFRSISSTKCVQPKHGLLERRDYTVKVVEKTVEKIVDKVEFIAKAEFLTMVRQGTLLIIDEIQNIKNLNCSFHACEMMIANISSGLNGTASRCMMLSGSPIDKKEQVIHLFRMMNIMKNNDLSVFIPSRMTNEWRGFGDIVDFAEKINPQHNIYLPPRDTGDTRRFKQIAYELFQKVIKQGISSSMIISSAHTDDGKTLQIIKFNGLYEIRDKFDYELLQEGVNNLSSVSGYNRHNDTVDFGHNGLDTFKRIIKSLIALETAKIPTMMRVAKKYLDENPLGKMVICVSYKQTIDDLQEGLQEFGPLILSGSVTPTHRTLIRNRFQADNNDRLLIANLKVCSSGIDLDDKFGHRPRFCIISPNYNTIDLYQVCYRFLRMDSKSCPTIHMMYGRHACEMPILRALAAKSGVMKETTSEQLAAGVVFPCDFPFWDELDDITTLDPAVLQMDNPTSLKPMTVDTEIALPSPLPSNDDA